MATNIQDILQEMRARETVACPHCGYVYDLRGDDFEFLREHTTYHGSENGAQKDECAHCGKTIWVEETVVRTWEMHAEEPEI